MQQTAARGRALRALYCLRLQLMLNVNRPSMIRLRIGWSLIAVLCACAPRGPSPTARAAQIDQEIPRLRLDSATVMGLSTEGATISASYRGRELRRLHASILGETGRTEETYYFDPELILVSRREFIYDAPLSGHIARSSASSIALYGDRSRGALRDSLEASARELLAALAEKPRVDAPPHP